MGFLKPFFLADLRWGGFFFGRMAMDIPWEQTSFYPFLLIFGPLRCFDAFVQGRTEGDRRSIIFIACYNEKEGEGEGEYIMERNS